MNRVCGLRGFRLGRISDGVFNLFKHPQFRPPNTTFVCAFSDEEVRRKLLGGTELTQEYLEKFFPVTVRLQAPDAAMVGRLFKTKVSKRFSEHPSWFAGTNEENKFTELLNQLWDSNEKWMLWI